MREHAITTLRQLLEVRNASLQEKMALQNLDANAANWKNWQDVVTLSGRRGKLLRVTLGTAIDAIELTRITVDRIRKFAVTQVSKNEGARSGPMLTVNGIRFNKVGDNSYLLSPLEVSRAKPTFDVIDRPARLRTKHVGSAKKPKAPSRAGVTSLDFRDLVIKTPTTALIKEFQKHLAEKHLSAGLRFKFWSQILEQRPESNAVRATWLNIAQVYGFDTYGVRVTQYTTWKDPKKRVTSTEILHKEKITLDEVMTKGRSFIVKHKLVGNHSAWVSDKLPGIDRSDVFEVAFYYTIPALWNAQGTVGELLKDDCSRLSTFFKNTAAHVPAIDTWSQI